MSLGWGQRLSKTLAAVIAWVHHSPVAAWAAAATTTGASIWHPL